MVIVDTAIWSLALRRRPETLSRIEQIHVDTWRKLTTAGRVLLPGIVRQELLSGVRGELLSNRLRGALDGFPTLLAELTDHDKAAECFNACRQYRIAPGDIDMLICAMALRLDVPIYTVDADFTRYTKVFAVRLFPAFE